MKYHFQRGKGSPWWAWWKSDKSFTQGLHFSIRLWETFIETTQLSPLAIRLQALHKPLTPRLREGSIITLIPARRRGKAKQQMEGLPKANPRTKDMLLGWGNQEKKKTSIGRKQTTVNLFSLSTSICMVPVLTFGSLRNPDCGKRNGNMIGARAERLGPGFGPYVCITGIIHTLNSTQDSNFCFSYIWDYSK